MAESVDALVSNTSGAIRPGSTPGLGTESESSLEGSDFLLVDSIKNYWGLQKNIGGFYKMALPDCKVIL